MQEEVKNHINPNIIDTLGEINKPLSSEELIWNELEAIERERKPSSEDEEKSFVSD